MPKRDNGHFYPDLDISVAGRQATRYRTTYDMQEELEEAQAEAKFCEDRSVNPYDHSIRDDESVNNDQSTGTVLESDAGLSVVNKTAPFTDLSHTKANGMLSVIENITGAPYAGLFVSGAPGLQAQTVRFKKFIEEYANIQFCFIN
jgi:hypothetical protein